MGSVSPPVPFVRLFQFVAMSWTRKRKAIVRITKECPRARMATTPRKAATTPVSNPATGTHTKGSPPTLVVRIAVV